MKTQIRFFVVLAASCLLIQGSALAEMVQGQVTAVNIEDRSLTVQKIAEAGKPQEQIKVSVPEDAEFRGIQSLDEVGVGDEIRAEARKPALGTGSWEARWIEKAGAGAAAGETKMPGQGQEKQKTKKAY